MSAGDLHGGYDEGDERLLAAEFVLGLVQGDAREALGRRAEADPHFAALVADWEAQLGGLANELAPVEAPGYLWGQISNRLMAAGAPPRTTARSTSLWDSLPFWRGLSLATSSLAAAGIAALVLLPGLKPAPAPPMVAVLKLDDGRSAFMASIDRNTGQVLLMPAVDGDAPPEHIHELWLIGGDGTPRSLGTFAARGPIAMPMPKDMMPKAGAQTVLAISVEPMGGSPTGQPTGPVVAKGQMQGI